MKNFHYCRYYMEEDGQTREVGDRINDECQRILEQISTNLDENYKVCSEE